MQLEVLRNMKSMPSLVFSELMAEEAANYITEVRKKDFCISFCCDLMFVKDAIYLYK